MGVYLPGCNYSLAFLCVCLCFPVIKRLFPELAWVGL